MKETIYEYKGYDIIGTSFHKEKIGEKRRYVIKKDGEYVIHPDWLFTTISELKTEIDNHIHNKSSL